MKTVRAYVIIDPLGEPFLGTIGASQHDVRRKADYFGFPSGWERDDRYKIAPCEITTFPSGPLEEEATEQDHLNAVSIYCEEHGARKGEFCYTDRARVCPSRLKKSKG